jgi:hypothetical protein
VGDDAPPAGDAQLEVESLDPVLVGIVREHQDRVVGWMRDQPGCWGFLAGQAVAACRAHTGRSLTGEERRLVWDRLWRLLESIKGRVLS